MGFIGINSIGDIGISAEEFSKAIENSTALKAFVTGLSFEQLKINITKQYVNR